MHGQTQIKYTKNFTSHLTENIWTEILLKKTKSFYTCDNRKEHVNKICTYNVEFLKLNSGGTYNNHPALVVT
jgi:hypothetical protein